MLEHPSFVLRREVSRRQALHGIGCLAAGAATLAVHEASAATPRQTGLGIVAYDCNLRAKWLKQQSAGFDLMKPLNFLKHCQSLGAGGMQLGLGALSAAEAAELRDYAEAHQLFIEAIVSPPKSSDDIPRFEAEIKAAREAGARAARTVIIPGRRYEHFKSFEAFQQAERAGEQMVELAVPVVEKYQVPLAIENHKDQRIDRRVALLKRIGSPFVGACIDTGNSLALLDDVYESISALAPYAFSVHFKDQSLKEYDEGFLLGDIPLGAGSLDLQKMLGIIRQARPQLQFCLEIITRDALAVPCLSDGYWQVVTEPSGRELARMLSYVKRHTRPAPSVSQLPLEQQVALEDQNIARCLEYAAQQLPSL